MKAWVQKNRDYVNWDRLGMGLSIVCALHCLLTPIIILSIPFMARYYLAHPLFHYLLAAAILPVGFYAFWSGLRHHHNWWVAILGVPGLFLVVGMPYLVHVQHQDWNEMLWMIVGSLLLISAHLINRKSCSACSHH